MDQMDRTDLFPKKRVSFGVSPVGGNTDTIYHIDTYIETDPNISTDSNRIERARRREFFLGGGAMIWIAMYPPARSVQLASNTHAGCL
jgi:hypothetical protein